MRVVPIFSVFLLMLFITSCVPPASPSNGYDTPSRVLCTEPRPEICAQIYDPVCGDNGKTYSSSCAACSDPAVSYSTKGECA